MKTSRFYKAAFFTLMLLCSFSISLYAQQKRGGNHNDSEKAGQPSPAPAAQTTKSSVKVEGTTIDYIARAGTISLVNNDEDTTAHIFYTAYLKDGVKDHSKRPIMFLYNGGPGSSTMWLHMGSFAPVRVGTKDTTHISGPPYELLKNEYSLLDATDLVFIDAPATGFSRIVGKGKDKDYLGLDQDAHAFEQFIKRYITKFGRWNSPKYLFGESYGTTRSAVLSNYLISRDNIDLNGVVLLSQILNYGNSVDGPESDPGNDMPYILALPTYAATAWYHHALPNRPADLDAFVKKVEDFATGEYSAALAKGTTLSDAELNSVAEKMHQYIGLPIAYLKKSNLRVNGGEFTKNLLADKNITVGRLDTRFTGPTMDPQSQRAYYDPQSAAISSAYVSVFNDYVRNTLHYGKKMQYRPSHYGQWDFSHGRSKGSPNVMGDLAQAMKHNPNLHVMLNTGYYDLATPFYEGIYELHHLPIEKRLAKNISIHLYDSGHMVYVHIPSLKKIHDNVAAFIKKTDNL